MTTYRFLQPLDVLYFRGNKLFGDPGSFGESLVPPWPSVAAGALRSQMLVSDDIDLADFAAGRVEHPSLGTPKQPGGFSVKLFHLARCGPVDTVSALYTPPADLVIRRLDDGSLCIGPLRPSRLGHGIRNSTELTMLPVLSEEARGKPTSGYWLTETGWKKYLAGANPDVDDLVASSTLWALDTRVGVGLDAAAGCAEDGKLFAAQAIAPVPGLGFLVGVAGDEPPEGGTVRLGGDGRAAAVRRVDWNEPSPDFDAIGQSRRCRIVLTSPAIFPGGWQLPETGADGLVRLGDVRGRLVCAAVPRAAVVSGWDLVERGPKPAERAAPTGSVYWLDDLEATPEALRKLADIGLWSEKDEDSQRRVEGFNRFAFAVY